MELESERETEITEARERIRRKEGRNREAEERNVGWPT